jgi:hypothetical protein
MKTVIAHYNVLRKNNDFLQRLATGLCLLIFSLVLSNYAGHYASRSGGNAVSDLILDCLPTYNVSIIHIYIALTFWLCLSGYILSKPALVPYICKTLALFALIRSVFICLTHLGEPANQLFIPDGFSSLLLFKGDLFFSGHVGGPFLMMLLFWDNFAIRIISLGASLFFAATVLIGHIHYSIDVFAAPFITYSIYQLSLFLFSRDYELSQQAINLDNM